MRKLAIAVLTALAAGAMLGGVAVAQTVPQTSPQTAAQTSPLSEEDQNASPLPPGRYAALVKKVCVDCHDAKRFLDVRYSREDAEGFYKNMVSSDLTTEQAQHIIEYLTTTLGQ